MSVSKLVAQWPQRVPHQIKVSGRREFTMRLFNPITMTEVIHGFHDTGGAIQLPEDNWFFTLSAGGYSSLTCANEKGEPSLMEIKSDISGNE
jgi:hypothetical protein